MRNRDVDAETYVNAIGPAARRAMMKTGIPASFLIADTCAFSQFGKVKVANLYESESPKTVEPWLGKYVNRWTYMMNQARGIQRYYKLKGQQTPLALLSFLQASGYFRNNPDQAATVAEFIRNGRFSEWDTLDAGIVRRLARQWKQSETVTLIRSLLSDQGLSNKSLLQYLQAAA